MPLAAGDCDNASMQKPQFEERPGGLADIGPVCDLGRSSIGEDHVGTTVLEERLRRNQRALRVLMRSSGDGVELCGYTIVYALTKAADDRLSIGSIRSGRDIRAEHFCPEVGLAACLYVGMVLGKDAHAKVRVKRMLVAEVTTQLADGPAVRRVYGRPASTPGRALLTQFGFWPVVSDDDIWAVGRDLLQAQLSGV